jgi:hypothetical protein
MPEKMHKKRRPTQGCLLFLNQNYYYLTYHRGARQLRLTLAAASQMFI